MSRRSLKKGPFVAPELYAKVQAAQALKAAGKNVVIKTMARGSSIIPEMIGLTLAVHDGREYKSIYITEYLVGHKLGEFFPTRKFVEHAGDRKTKS